MFRGAWSKALSFAALLSLVLGSLVLASPSSAEAAGRLPLPSQVSCFWKATPLPKKDCSVRDLYAKVYFATAGSDVAALRAAAWSVYGPYRNAGEVEAALQITFGGKLSRSAYSCVRANLLNFILDLNRSRKNVATMNALYDAAKKLTKPLGASAVTARTVSMIASNLKSLTNAVGKMNETTRARSYAKVSAACSVM